MPPVPPSPRLLKGGLVLLNPDGGGNPRVIALQYNPDTLTRTLQAQTAGADSHDGRAEPLRFKGPPVETIKLDAEIDATDSLERGDGTAGELGILPQLSALEAFDPNLHPIRAKVSLGLRVLTVADLGFDTKAGSLYLEYQRQKEQAAARAGAAGLDVLGLRALP